MSINVSPLIPTESQPGYVAVATTLQVEAGTSDSTFLSPLKAGSNYVGYYKATRAYGIGSVCFHGSQFWRAVTANLGVTPVEGVNWTSTTSSIPNATNTTYGLTQVASSAEIAVGTSDKVVTVAGLTYASSSFVKTTGDQTISGYKTFNSPLGLRVSADNALITAYHSGVSASNTNLYNGPTSFGIYDSQFGNLIAKAKSNGKITFGGTLESPEMSGDPTAPTQLIGDSSTKIATTEFVGKSSGLGVGQTWQNVTSSRVVGTGDISLATRYQNTTNKPIQVSITFFSFLDANIQIRVATTPTSSGIAVALYAEGGTSNFHYRSIQGVVPVGAYYMVMGPITNWPSGPNLGEWLELR